MAQGHSETMHLPGFTLRLSSGDKWGITRPSDLYAGVGGWGIAKTPNWFPISSHEIPLPILPWTSTIKWDNVGYDQIVFMKKLGKGDRRGAYFVRAAWSDLPFTDAMGFLQQIAAARKEELARSAQRLVSFAAHPAPAQNLNGCLQVDAVFSAEPGEKSSSPVVTTRRYLCSHPDIPGYFVEIGYGQETSGNEETINLETELAPFLESLAFTHQEDLLQFPSLKAAMIPVGFRPASLSFLKNETWIRVGDSWLMCLDLRSNKPIGAVHLKSPTADSLVAADALWLARNEVLKKFPDSLDTGVLHFLDKMRPNGDQNVALTATSRWLALPSKGVVERQDLQTGNIVATIELPRVETDANAKKKDPKTVPTGVGADALHVWVLNDRGLVMHIDPANNQVTRKIILPTSKPLNVVLTQDVAWVADSSQLWRIDASTFDAQAFSISGFNYEYCEWAGDLWVLEFSETKEKVTAAPRKVLLHHYNSHSLKETEAPLSLGTSVESKKVISPSGIHFAGCRDRELWLYDRSGVLFRLDMAEVMSPPQ